MSALTEYLSFCDWLVSLSVLSSGLVRVAAWVKICNLSVAEECSTAWVGHGVLTCPLLAATWAASVFWLV